MAVSSLWLSVDACLRKLATQAPRFQYRLWTANTVCAQLTKPSRPMPLSPDSGFQQDGSGTLVYQCRLTMCNSGLVKVHFVTVLSTQPRQIEGVESCLGLLRPAG